MRGGWIINKKFLSDLKNGFKEIHEEVIKDKKYKIDYAAGTSLGPSPHNVDNLGNLSMRKYEVFSLVLGIYSYPVEKELWDTANKGDIVRLEFAPKTKELLNIELDR